MSLEVSITVRRAEFAVALDATVAAGATLALLGPNGAGKSTILQALAGLVDASGTIRLGGRSLQGVEPERRRVGYVFQDYLLFPHLTVLENVAFGPRSRGHGRLASRAAATRWLERLDIADLAGRRPPQLSGGQQQRVALARALASDPELLLLDEPLAALDVAIRDEVRAELARHIREWGGPTIVVTHHFEDARVLADHVIVIEEGRTTQTGTVADLVRAPSTAYVRRLVASGADG
ncbi:ABC transporter ATP-binding protein [Microcella daejeonensis]|uniref:ABC transporter ATP-binding protein n=1 Tax=Microcella daejeonensis TaxID=2994971 RepID=UPI0022711BA0|nr:ABC transporter ATP-binding protein [Microcella daejeonensis]WAB83154.1 ABC transporter ATP-binding protein [Microcella daejeonensis]